jgi:hypothetical protein
MFDPKLGRFLQRDPLAFGGGDSNLYDYVRSRPACAADPTGTIPVGGVVSANLGLFLLRRRAGELIRVLPDLIASLDARSFAEREQASQRLEFLINLGYGEDVEVELKHVMKHNECSLEFRTRAERLLERIRAVKKAAVMAAINRIYKEGVNQAIGALTSSEYSGLIDILVDMATRPVATERMEGIDVQGARGSVTFILQNLKDHEELKDLVRKKLQDIASRPSSIPNQQFEAQRLLRSP